MRRPGDLANDERKRAALGTVRGIDIAHRDRRVDRWAETATGHTAGGIAGGIDNRGPLARRSAPVGTDADPFPCRPFGELAQDDRCARETALGSAPFADRPREPGLDRRRGFIDIVTVETQSGFEAQRVAG